MTALTESERQAWFRQHIKSRVFAMMSKPSLLRAQIDQLPDDSMEMRFRLECLLQAAREGRQAAIRWLIEFVGVGPVHGKEVTPPKKRKHDFRIDDMNGALLDLSTNSALKLAQLREDISKATAHPTRGSGHETVSEERIKEAAEIIVEHLFKEIYQPAGESL